MVDDKRMFDGNYHCAYCGKVFRIAYQAEFIEHQENCAMEPSPDRVEAVAKLLYFKAGGDGWEKEPDKPKHYLDLGKETFRKTARSILSLFPEPELTPSLKFELENMRPQYQDILAWLLAYASGMGDYGDPHGLWAVVSPRTGKVLVTEKDCPAYDQQIKGE